MPESAAQNIKNLAGNFFIGLDLSLVATGVSIYNASGTGCPAALLEIKTKPSEWDFSLARCNHIAGKIVNLLKTRDVCLIVLEDYFMGKMQGSVIPLCELGTIVRLRLLEAGYPFITVMPSQLKKFVTGVGAGPKDVVIKHVFKKWSLDTNSNNMADAYGLSRLAEALWLTSKGMHTPLKYEKEVIDKILKERQFVVPFAGLPGAMPVA